jgi:hypothetical protein
MAIVYALVARGTVVLAEFAAVTGNAGAVARRILEKLPHDAEARLCFAQDRYIFHVLRGDAGITFLCMANDTFGSMCNLSESNLYTSFMLLLCVGATTFNITFLHIPGLVTT